MAIRTELTIHIQNSPGAAARVCAVLDEERVNILAMQIEAGVTMRLLLDNHVHAAASLRERNYQVHEREVLYTVISNEPGSIRGIIRLLAEAGVNVEYLYATAVEGEAQAAVVVGVPDARRASVAAGF